MVVFNRPINGALRIKTPSKISLGKVYDLNNPKKTYTPEEIHRNEYFIHLDKEDLTAPKVIVIKHLRTGGETKGYEKAKT
ncbi:hypothetical protein [Echinicola rosea]|uniref:Uncharacterized protein n=1 Tax=Echinicola rosea TaxID=1807691 RepID=A0ABQ1UI89_9BACT|nr:hypothetical protein [Echinicola rosea]GGF18046.1 hypothetical protein GCM10011339_02440 [Echinicola rosea]